MNTVETPSSSEFSVLIPVYINEKSEYLQVCLQSIFDQSLKPNEVVIVEDGPISDALDKKIEYWQSKLPIKRLKLKSNKGLGVALQAGVLQCSYEIIARMDADDFADFDRFKKQVQFLEAQKDIDIVGSWISEFDKEITDITGQRKLPISMAEILTFSKFRNPLNHMTVMFRKKAIINAGNYKTQEGFEDYYLWVRAILKGSKFANIPQSLVLARCGNGLVVRRRGLKYLLNEFKFQKEIHSLGFLSFYELTRNLCLRAVVRVFSAQVISLLYLKLLRKT